MKQKSKTYEQPEMEVVKLETQPLLAGSQTTGDATGDDMYYPGGM